MARSVRARAKLLAAPLALALALVAARPGSPAAAAPVTRVAQAVPARASAADAAAAAPEQVVTVRAAHASSTRAKIGLWRRQDDGSYRRIHGPYRARIGAAGVGRAAEGLARTPAGVFTLTQAFGNWPDPGTRLTYFQAGPRDWWDENPASATYNRHVVSTTSPGGDSENLYDVGRAYAHAVVIDYNTRPVVEGAGSGFFLHVTLHRATAGCVTLSHRHLIRVMRWLNPRRHPVMSIGVGTHATRILHGGS